MPYDPDLTEEQNKQLDEQIEALIKIGYSKYQAMEAAPIMLGLSDGDIEYEEEQL